MAVKSMLFVEHDTRVICFQEDLAFDVNFAVKGAVTFAYEWLDSAFRERWGNKSMLYERLARIITQRHHDVVSLQTPRRLVENPAISGHPILDVSQFQCMAIIDRRRKGQGRGKRGYRLIPAVPAPAVVVPALAHRSPSVAVIAPAAAPPAPAQQSYRAASPHRCRWNSPVAARCWL